MMPGKALTSVVRVMLILFALHVLVRPLEHAMHHEDVHHPEALSGATWSDQCADCEVEKLPVVPMALQWLPALDGYPVDHQWRLPCHPIGKVDHGVMGRAPPALLS